MGVVREGLIAASLTSIMILVFLGSWRSTLIICVSIPLSILTSLLLLSVLGESINVMTLGGLALAVGVLVDDATVEIENMQRNLAMGKNLRQAILDGAQEIAVPAFVSTVCISIVFVPMFFLSGVSRYLFVPLAEAVVFALFASYFFSRTIIPTLVMFLLPKEVARKSQAEGGGQPGWFARLHAKFEHAFESLQHRYTGLLAQCLEHRDVFAGIVSVVLRQQPRADSIAWAGFLSGCGRRPVPAASACQDRHPSRRDRPAGRRSGRGTSVRESRRRRWPASWTTSACRQAESIFRTATAARSANADAEILGSLQPKHHPTADYVAALRSELPKKFPGTSFFFEPADIVAQTLNFGIPAPLDIQIVGRDVAGNFALASQMAEQMRHVPGAVDVHIQQMEDQPRLQYDVDRVRLQQVGLTERDVASNLLVSLSSSFQTTPNFWLNPANGVSYNIAVQTPQYRIDSLDAINRIPVNAPGVPNTQLLRNLTTMTPQEEPAVVSHYNVAPVIDIYGSVQGRDLGGVAADIAKITAQAARHLPRGSTLVTRGQVATMRSSFRTLCRVRHCHCAGVPAAGRQLPVLDGGLHHHHRTARGAGRNLLDSPADAHDAERAGFDGHHHEHRRGYVEQCAGHHFRQRTFRRKQGRPSRCARGGRHTAPAGNDDGAGDDHRHGAHGAWPWRRWRAKCAARPRCHRRAAVCNRRHAVLRSHYLLHGSARFPSLTHPGGHTCSSIRMPP